jgi:hypothetical protein
MSIGANGAVSSLWPAGDGPTLFLMTRLMRELHSGTPPLRALKDAQVWLSNSTGTQLAEVLRSLRLPQEAMRRSCSRSLESATAERNTWKSACPEDLESLPCVSSRNDSRATRIRPSFRGDPMLMTKEKRTAIQTLRGWATAVLQEAGAIRESEYHGWMQDRADPYARKRTFEFVQQDPPPGVSPEAAAVAVTEVLDSIGDTCPECPPEA